MAPPTLEERVLALEERTDGILQAVEANGRALAAIHAFLKEDRRAAHADRQATHAKLDRILAKLD